MPQDPAAAVSALLRASTIDDHDEVLKATNAAIKANKTDYASHHTRIVALLKLDRFDDALRAISEGGDRLEEQCRLEKVYALYKTGKLEDAAKAIQAASADDRGFKHIAAQVSYRAERFEEAHAIYSQLLASDPDDEESDLAINLKAVLAQQLWQGNPPASPDEEPSLDTFELCYNAACGHIARGALDTASNLLQRAVRLCDASDDLTDEDKQAEMQPILAQQAYVYARQGKVKEALDLYKSLDKSSDIDGDTHSIAQNNQTALDAAPTNPFLLQRKTASWLASGKKAKLFEYQSSLLDRNELVIDLMAQKIDGVKKRTSKAISQAQHPTVAPEVNTLSVLNAAAETHGASDKEALRQLTALADKRPQDLGLALAVVQVHMQHGQTGAALAKFEAFLQRLDKAGGDDVVDSRLSPGVVALTASLLRTQGREASAKSELVKAAKYWTTRSGRSEPSLLREAGIELLRSSNAADLSLAGAAFEKLFKEHHGSHIASAGLVASLATSDPSKVQKHVAELPSVDSLIGGVDVSALLDAGVAAAPNSGVARKRPAATADADGAEKTAKRRRKRKLPKNYEPGKTPDPERWLPLRDRSSYRPKGRKGKKKAGESTQGGVVKEEETLELVGGGGVKVEKASGGGPSNKKKKKGKK
jgi:signal recognition particle subunit SRP72